MSHVCRLVRNGSGVDARWRRDGDTLIVSPTSGLALAIALGEVSGISGDGFTISLRTSFGDVTLERLGADGPTLLQELRRDWPALRARLLRLNGSDSPDKFFSGTVASKECRGAFRGFLSGDRLIFAPEGADIKVLFLADCNMISFTEQTYAVNCTGWEGEETIFSKLGGETAAFTAVLQTAREKLTQEAGTTLARHLPTLAPAVRAELGSQWLPGRMLSFAALERMAPGFEAAFLASWLASCPRADEGRKLMEGIAISDRYLGFAVAGEGEEPILWLLVRCANAWSLELLSHGDYATYLFAGGDELPRLVSGIIRLPDFSREALYLPMEELTGERAKYTIPARDLPLLSDLRARFTGRRIHTPRQ